MMRTLRPFRRPLSLGATLLLLFWGASDALGVRVCAHHLAAGHEPTSEHASPDIGAHGHDAQGHRGHRHPGEHHHGHPAAHAHDHDPGQEHAPGHDGSVFGEHDDFESGHGGGHGSERAEKCDCGSVCLGGTSTPPLRAGDEVALLDPDAPPSPGEALGRESLAAPTLLPYVLPYAQAPPTHS